MHFPTDLNLLYDSLRKGVETIAHLCKEDKTIKGWRKHKSIISDVKSLFRTASHKVFKGKNESEKRQSVKNYLHKAREINKRLMDVINVTTSIITAVVLQHYIDYIHKFINQIERRLLKGEVIPPDEKIFSIVEPHTEWITKGKLNKKVELGHLLLITTDQHSFIVDYKVMDKQRDPSQINDLVNRLKTKFLHATRSLSFDKGFWSKDNLALLEASDIPVIVLPKRGRHTKEDTIRESSADFHLLRRKHSAVESNINMLEHHGLNRCPDKGLNHFKNYVGLSILAYNLHQLGKLLIAQKQKEKEKNVKRKGRLVKNAA